MAVSLAVSSSPSSSPASLTPLAARVAWRLDVVDRPGPLKVQSRPVPYLGGVAVFAGLAVPVFWTRPAALIPIGLAMALGLADDIGDLHSGLRFASEAAIGVVVGGRHRRRRAARS